MIRKIAGSLGIAAIVLPAAVVSIVPFSAGADGEAYGPGYYGMGAMDGGYGMGPGMMRR